MVKPKDFPLIRMPSDEEIAQGCRDAYEVVSFTYIDKWSPELMALSIPTKLVELSREEHGAFTKLHDPGGKFEGALTALAARLDIEMGWSNYFVRLNSRSPKDQSYPSMPVTCAGRQAVLWLGCSERTFDDLCMMWSAERTAYIALREWRYIAPDSEFRCFVKDGELLGATQYHAASEFVLENAWPLIRTFFAEHVKAAIAAHTYVFDVFFDHDGIHLLEINPFWLSDPILFGSYDEVLKGGFRTPEKDGGQP